MKHGCRNIAPWLDEGQLEKQLPDSTLDQKIGMRQLNERK